MFLIEEDPFDPKILKYCSFGGGTIGTDCPDREVFLLLQTPYCLTLKLKVIKYQFFFKVPRTRRNTPSAQLSCRLVCNTQEMCSSKRSC